MHVFQKKSAITTMEEAGAIALLLLLLCGVAIQGILLSQSQNNLLQQRG
jgi:hypothetical protein